MYSKVIQLYICIYGVGQKVRSGFSIRCDGKIQMNFLANPIYIFLFTFFSITVYYKILNIVPCAIQ